MFSKPPPVRHNRQKFVQDLTSTGGTVARKGYPHNIQKISDFDSERPKRTASSPRIQPRHRRPLEPSWEGTNFENSPRSSAREGGAIRKKESSRIVSAEKPVRKPERRRNRVNERKRRVLETNANKKNGEETMRRLTDAHCLGVSHLSNRLMRASLTPPRLLRRYGACCVSPTSSSASCWSPPPHDTQKGVARRRRRQRELPLDRLRLLTFPKGERSSSS